MCHPDTHAHPASQLLSYSAVDCRHHVHHTRDGRQTPESNQYAAAIRLHGAIRFVNAPNGGNRALARFTALVAERLNELSVGVGTRASELDEHDK